MKKVIFILFILVYSALFCLSIYIYQEQSKSMTIRDSGQLLPVSMQSIHSAQSAEKLQDMLANSDTTFSIAGMQHTQGGHTMYPQASMIDMKGYNGILDLDLEEKTIRVQAGATWADLQEALQAHQLAIKVSQSQNIFTVGGSISANVHGRDIRHDALIETVESFRLLLADGEIIEVSREENADLFPYVIGGYGLFGLILDVTLSVTEDELYEHEVSLFDYRDYPSFIQENVVADEEVRMHLARLSTAPDSFLTEMYATNYRLAENQANLEKHSRLKRERLIAIPKFFLGLARYSDWGKNLFWSIQKKYTKETDGKLESRNNVMRSDSQFMEYESTDKAEVLQEYFIPVHKFPDYIDDLRELLEGEEDFNLLNITVRYVQQNEEAVLSYAKEDMVALVLLIHLDKDKAGRLADEEVIRQMIDLTLDYDGSYYLPYYPFATKEQLNKAYPDAQAFFEKKRAIDPNERWMNLFYEEYGK